jgi:hypothetical protein
MKNKFIYGKVLGMKRLIGCQYKDRFWSTEELASRIGLKRNTMQTRLSKAVRGGQSVEDAINPRRSRSDCGKMTNRRSSFIDTQRKQSIAILAINGPAVTPPPPEEQIDAGKRRHRVEDIIESRLDSQAVAEVWE